MRQNSCMAPTSYLKRDRAGSQLLAPGHSMQVDMRVAAYLHKESSGSPGSWSQDGPSDKLDLLLPLPLRMCVVDAQEPAKQGGQRCVLQKKAASSIIRLGKSTG